MTFFHVLVVAAAFLNAGLQPPQDIHTDGHGIAPREETTRSYDCGTITGTIRYRVERLDHPVEHVLVRRVTLLGIAVNGRDLPQSELASASEVFRRFGEIEGLGSNCENGFLDVRVFGYLPSELTNQSRTGQEPRIELWTIRLSRNGIVFVRH